MSEIRRLQTFLDFVRLGTVAAVAQDSQYSTSAVSQQLERLASELGVPLLEPHGRALRLTPAGEELAGLGQRLLDDWETIQARLAATRNEVVGSVRVASFQTGCLAFFPPLLDNMRQAFPRVSVSCAQAEPERSLPALRAREIDVAIVERYPGQSGAPASDLLEQPLADDGMLIAMPPHWEHRADLADLAERPWVFEAPGSPARAWAESMCHEAGFSPRIAHETSDVVVQCALAASGAAAALIPELTPPALRGGAHCVPLPREFSRRLFAVTRRSAAEHPGVGAVLTEIERVVLARGRVGAALSAC